MRVEVLRAGVRDVRDEPIREVLLCRRVERRSAESEVYRQVEGPLAGGCLRHEFLLQGLGAGWVYRSTMERRPDGAGDIYQRITSPIGGQ